MICEICLKFYVSYRLLAYSIIHVTLKEISPHCKEQEHTQKTYDNYIMIIASRVITWGQKKWCSKPKSIEHIQKTLTEQNRDGRMHLLQRPLEIFYIITDGQSNNTSLLLQGLWEIHASFQLHYPNYMISYTILPDPISKSYQHKNSKLKQMKHEVFHSILDTG